MKNIIRFISVFPFSIFFVEFVIYKTFVERGPTMAVLGIKVGSGFYQDFDHFQICIINRDMKGGTSGDPISGMQAVGVLCNCFLEQIHLVILN